MLRIAQNPPAFFPGCTKHMELTTGSPPSTFAKPHTNLRSADERTTGDSFAFKRPECKQTIVPVNNLLEFESRPTHPPPPKDDEPVKAMPSEWKTYRTRFLIRARQLDQPLTFVDCIGREHSGVTGDYLVLSSDGSRRIAPREIFEDIYVPMDQAADPWPVAVQLASLLPADLIDRESFESEDELVCRTLKSPSPQCLPSPTMRTHKMSRRRTSEKAYFVERR